MTKYEHLTDEIPLQYQQLTHLKFKIAEKKSCDVCNKCTLQIQGASYIETRYFGLYW
jgi:hypothetical protein